ncbi:uncharacterized protein LOC135955646 [Calliphora vicina]|uniref:uncharacterized protein LOC135955646 n=1 Tax=Calliphora vicina TaxID=7373 RepID=UPI00325ADADD
MKTLKILILLLAAVLAQAGVVPSRIREGYSEDNTTEGPTNSTTEGFPNSSSVAPTTEGFTNSTSRPPVTEGPESEFEGVVVKGDCAFRVTGDLHDPAPLFTYHGTYEWLVPTPEGVVELKNGQYIDMYCTDSFANPFDNKSAITAQCLQGLYFLVNGTIFPFSNFSCSAWPNYTARRTGRQCSGGTDLLEVGFEVQGGFLQTMDICHDEINEVTRYVHHVLNPSSSIYQRSVARPRFIEADFYAGKNVDNLYTKVQQNKTISSILGMDASPYFNDTIDVFMARGHMGAKTDFIFGSPQRATFLFVNVAPQWQSFNGGNWERVEDGVRKYVSNNSLTVDCYTGIWGIATLPDVNGTQRELYLSIDENNNGLIPVPKIYYRVVIDRATRQGIVLIGVNNPHASLQQIKEEYTVCEDIGEKIDWLQWNKEDLHKGYSYACSVPDFLRVVKDLPVENLETTGVLGINEVGCSFRVSGDLNDPAPLYARAGVYDWLVPQPNGLIELKYGESIDMYCSNSFVKPFQNHSKISAQCLKGYEYLVNGENYNFTSFSCSAWPTYTARRTGRLCNGGTDLLEVGFKVSQGFLQTMDICHDEINEVTRYVHHVLNPSSSMYQRSVTRPRFIEGDFFAGKNVDNLYTKVQQNNTISSILGMDASGYFNDSKNIYMARGHMAAKVDFIFGSPQRSTFFFVNVAPQWQAFNAGNWERVEDGVRKYVSNNGLTVDCYTGVWGVSTLPDVNGTHRELYLAFDENNNGLIPVPKIYFRVVIDRESRKGIVLIGVNNPHASLQQIQNEYIVCNDIGHQIDWINWSKEDIIKGYSYACSVPDFLQTVQDLPLDKLQTTGVLGLRSVYWMVVAGRMMSRVFVKVFQQHYYVAVLIVLTLSSELFVVDVECRRAIQPVEDVEDIVKQLNNINLNVVDNEGPPCLLDVQQDLPKGNTPQPLYIIPDTNQFWLPNARGQLQVPRGAAIELHCSKSFANATEGNNGSASSTNKNQNNRAKFSNILQVAKNTKTLRPRCLHDKTFLWQGEKYEFPQFICEQPAKYMVEQLYEKCPTMTDGQASVKAQMYRVGFNISSSRFLETMRICYDDTVLSTLYVQHTLLPANIHFQRSIKRLNFSKAGHFKDVNMNHLYTQQYQRQQAAALLQGQHEHLFDNNTLFLARGHLAAKSDFIYGNQQRATFNFFNVAPQWQAFNGGQWAALEDEVRKFVAKSQLLVDCYTGTFGVLQLPYKAAGGDGGLHYHDFYLTMDMNNNGILPVPQLYYRVLIDRSGYATRGIALVGVNNPHATLSEIHASYIICDDIHDQVPWLRWMRNKNLKKGFMYACHVPDFVAAVGHLPKSLLNVTELLV